MNHRSSEVDSGSSDRSSRQDSLYSNKSDDIIKVKRESDDY